LADLAMCDHRAHPRHAALGFAHMPPDEPERLRLHRWRDAMHGAGGSTYRKTHLYPAPCRV